MNIYYSDNTLYVNFKEEMDYISMDKLKKRVFSILDDYDIENIVLHIVGESKDSLLLDEFLREYNSKYHGNLLIK